MTLASYNSDTKEIEWFKNFNIQLPEMTEEVKTFWEALGKDPDIKITAEHSFLEITDDLDVADNTFKNFIRTTRETGTVYKTSEEALAGYQSYLKSSGKAAQFANLKTKALSASMKIFSTIGWMAIAALTANIIGKVVEGFDIWIHRVDKANDAMETAVDVYRSAQNELENINKQLEEQDLRINELLAKDKLTYAEEDELEKLQKITKELLIQQDIEERSAKQASKEAAEKAVNAYRTQYGDYEITKDNMEEELAYIAEEGRFPIPQNKNDVIGNIAAYIRSAELLASAQNKYNEAVKNQEDTAWLGSDVQFYTDMASDYEDIIDNNISDLIDKKNALEDEYNKAIEKKEQSVSPLTTDENEAIETYESIADAIRLIYEYTNPSAWNNMEIENIFNSVGIEKTKDELIAMAKSGELTPENIAKNFPKLYNAIRKSEFILADGQTAAQAFFKEINACADASDSLETDIPSASPLPTLSHTITQLSNRVKPALASLQSAYQEIFTTDHDGNPLFNLGSIDISSFEAIRSALEDLRESGAVVSSDVFENFVSVLTDSSSSAEQVRSQFSTLAGAIINATDCTAAGGDAFNILVQTLTQLGISNAAEVLTALGNAQKEITARGYDLADITAEQAAQFLKEGMASAAAAEYLRFYMIQKQLSEQPLNTSGDVEALESLCNSLSVTGELYQAVAYLKSSLAAVESGAPLAAYQSGIEEAKSKIASLSRGEGSFTFEFKPPKADADAFKKAAGKTAADYTKLLDAELNALDTRMDAGLLDFHDYMALRYRMIEKYYQDGRLAAEEYYDYLGRHYDTQLSYMDKVISYVTSRLGQEIDAYQDQIELVEQRYEGEIEYLDTVIQYYEDQKSALQNSNDELDRQLALEQAVYNFERAQTQRTQKIYTTNQGYIYTADGDAVKDASEAVRSARLDMELAKIDDAIKKIENQQDALKEAMNTEVNALNSIIDNLEQYKEQWSSVASEYENKQNEILANQILGADCERDILNARLDVLNSFKNNYLAIQQAMVDAARIAGEQMDGMQEGQTGITGTGSSSETGRTPVTDPAAENKSKGTSAAILGAALGLNSVINSGSKNSQSALNNLKKKAEKNASFKQVMKYHTGLKEGPVENRFRNDDFRLVQKFGLQNNEVPAVLKKNEAVLTEIQTGNLADALRQIPINSTVQNVPLPDYSHLPNAGSKNTGTMNTAQSVIQNISITMPNITNEAGFNNFKKEMDRFRLDAVQFARRRH